MPLELDCDRDMHQDCSPQQRISYLMEIQTLLMIMLLLCSRVSSLSKYSLRFLLDLKLLGNQYYILQMGTPPQMLIKVKG